MFVQHDYVARAVISLSSHDMWFSMPRSDSAVGLALYTVLVKPNITGNTSTSNPRLFILVIGHAVDKSYHIHAYLHLRPAQECC